MSLYKRPGSENWWIQFTDANGRRVQRSAGTSDRQAAQELHDRLKAESWRQKHLGEKPSRTWKEAAVRWLREKEGEKKSIETDRYHLKWLHPYLVNRRLDEITEELIEELRQKKLAEVSTGRVNRVFATLRAILRRAERNWKWIDRAPTVQMFREKPGRVRWLTREEADRLLDAMPPHLAEMARFTLATGLRMRNVLDLEWSRVDLERECCWIEAEDAKGGKAIPAPLNPDALACVRRQIGVHPQWVFTYRGRRQGRVDSCTMKECCQRADIKDFRWHDLRHTWASWHIQKGTPLHVLQALGAWSDIKMVQRYAHLSADHLAEWAGNVDAPKPKLRRVK